MRPLRVRGHHCGCVVLEMVKQAGDHPTVPAMARWFQTNPDGLVEVVVGVDDVCRPCPHWVSDTCDRGFEALNRAKDAAFLEAMGLLDGQRVLVRQLLALLESRTGLEFYRRVCPGCSPDACAASVESVVSGGSQRRSHSHVSRSTPG